MTQEDRDKWNARYQAGSHGGRVVASIFLQDWLLESPGPFKRRLTPRSSVKESDLARPRALDVACGTGRNSVFLAQSGFTVDAVDISARGLERARKMSLGRNTKVQWIEADLDDYRFSGSAYDLIILFRYKNIAMMPKLVDALKPGGYFVCEQHLQSAAGVVGPTNAKFRWAAGELPELLSACALTLESCFEGLVQDPDSKPAALARLVARKEVTREGIDA